MSKDYKKMYHMLYEEVAKLLVNNRRMDIPYNKYQLLSRWDDIRNKVENLNQKGDE